MMGIYLLSPNRFFWLRPHMWFHRFFWPLRLRYQPQTKMFYYAAKVTWSQWQRALTKTCRATFTLPIEPCKLISIGRLVTYNFWVMGLLVLWCGHNQIFFLFLCFFTIKVMNWDDLWPCWKVSSSKQWPLWHTLVGNEAWEVTGWLRAT